MWSMNRVAISHRLSRAPWARYLLSTHSHRCSHLGLIHWSRALPLSSCSPFSSCVGLFSLNVGLFLSLVGLFCMGHYSATLSAPWACYFLATHLHTSLLLASHHCMLVSICHVCWSLFVMCRSLFVPRRFISYGSSLHDSDTLLWLSGCIVLVCAGALC